MKLVSSVVISELLRRQFARGLLSHHLLEPPVHEHEEHSLGKILGCHAKSVCFAYLSRGLFGAALTTLIKDTTRSKSTHLPQKKKPRA